MKIAKILLPFDNSPPSLNAANYALTLAKLSEAHVTVVTCYDAGNWELSGISDFLIEGIKANRKKTAEEILHKAEMIFMENGVAYRLEAIAGRAGEVFARQAQSREYDLIIMGSHGHSDIAGLFLGSVTHKVLNTIYCPVLIVP
ncbi:universal stress protein [Desulfopila sp. IMCC35006]|uniref:universal stress protein n=1 Tax=Desulfopila sp. IMCC35006 TaxID=2569542 RepID=UPI0010AC837F|nr:universal stress protein [Desulfopila sp. IMCC35006]TKB24261.1 universal stress protein [Desulfopila sp. IMCC35006]